MSSPTLKTEPASTPSSTGSNAISSSSPDRTGRDGFLSLAFERRLARTVLARSQFRLPLQVLAPLPLPSGAAYLMLLNPAGGLNGGDRARTSIHLAPGAHACLATPSAARVYRALDAPSLQHTSIRLEASAHLDFLPDHLIPHSGADLLQSLHLDLHPSASAVLWDAFAAGRVASGELWQFRRLDSRLQVFSAGEPLFVSRSLLRPALQSPAAFAVMEQFPYTATLLALGPFDAAPAALALSALLASIPGLRASASPLRRHGLSLRILAASTVALAAARTLAWNWIRESLLGLPVIDLRKY